MEQQFQQLLQVKQLYLNTSYAASYWPWVKVFDSDLSKNVWAPASTIIPAVYAANDAAADAWFAPAGFNRGGLPGVTATERGLKRSLRDTLILKLKLTQLLHSLMLA